MRQSTCPRRFAGGFYGQIIKPVKLLLTFIHATFRMSQLQRPASSETMFYAQLRRPSPEVARPGERWHDDRCKQSGALWRKEQLVLAGNDGRVLPVKTDRGGTQPHQGGINTVGDARKFVAKIQVDVGAGVRAAEIRPERPQTYDGLAHGGARRAGWNPESRRCDPGRNILIVEWTAVAEEIEKDDS